MKIPHLLLLLIIFSTNVQSNIIIEDDNLLNTNPISPDQEIETMKILKGYTNRLFDMTFDPYKSKTSLNTHHLSLIYDTFVLYDPQSQDVIPNILVDWAVTPDAKQWNLKLREGVFFHDGKELNASSVKFNFDRLFMTSHPNYVDPNESIVFHEVISRLESVDIVSKYEVSVKFSKGYSPFINDLSYYFIVSPFSFQNEFIPIGTGPFQYINTTEDGLVDYYERNNNYFKGIPLIKSIESETIAPETFFQTLGENYFDLYPFQSGYYEYPNYETILNEEVITRWMGVFNFESETMQQVGIRRAINYAINQDAIIDELNVNEEYERFKKLETVFFNNTPYVQNNEIYFSHNSDKATREMNSLGYSKENPISIDVVTVGLSVAIVDRITTQLESVGFEINATLLLSSEEIFSENLNFDMLIGGYTLASGFDPADTVSLFGSGNPLNLGNFNSNQMDELIARSIEEPVKQYRSQIHYDMITSFRQDVPFVNIFGFKVGYIVKSTVKDFVHVLYDRKIQVELIQEQLPDIIEDSEFSVDTLGKYFWRLDNLVTHNSNLEVDFNISNQVELADPIKKSYDQIIKRTIQPSIGDLNYEFTFLIDNLESKKIDLMVWNNNKWEKYDYNMDDDLVSLQIEWKGDLQVFVGFVEVSNQNVLHDIQYMFIGFAIFSALTLTLMFDKKNRVTRRYISHFGKLSILAPKMRIFAISLLVILFTTTVLLYEGLIS